MDCLIQKRHCCKKKLILTLLNVLINVSEIELMNQLFNCIYQPKNATPWKSIVFDSCDLSISNVCTNNLPKRTLSSRCMCLNILSHNIIITPQVFTEYVDNITFQSTRFNKIFDIDAIGVSCFENAISNQNEFLTIDKCLFDFRIPRPGSECVIDNNTTTYIHCQLTQINHFRQFISSPIIPFISVRSSAELDNKLKRTLIGSSVLSNDKIIGIVVSVNNNNIICVPIYVIIRMIQNKILNNGHYILPCNCDVVSIQYENAPIDGLRVKEIYKKCDLSPCDILHKINGIVIQNAMVYNKELNISIDFNTYIALLCQCSIKVSYFIDLGGEYVSCEKNIMLTNINDIMKIKPKAKEFVNYKSLFICELSDDVLNSISNGRISEYCDMNDVKHFGDSDIKYVALIDTNDKEKLDRFAMKINIIRCVDNHEIKTISEFINMCQNGKKHMITYSCDGIMNVILI